MGGPFDPVSPLPADIRRSLVAITVVGMCSLVATALLWLHITYRLILWKIRDRRFLRRQLEPPPKSAPAMDVIDLNLGLVENHYYQARRYNNKNTNTNTNTNNNGDTVDILPPTQAPLEKSETRGSKSEGQVSSTRREKPPNPLLLLIYNLILSDCVLSASYANNLFWLRNDGIIVPSLTCSIQGWIVSVGCITTSGFLFSISIFSFLGIIHGYKAKPRDVLAACIVVWFMSFLLSSIGPMAIRDGTFYGRETTWCWISQEHKLWRLCVYLWGFPATFGTCLSYSVIFYRLYRENRSSRWMPRRRGSQGTTGSRASGMAVANGSDAGGTNNTNNNNNTTTTTTTTTSTPLRPSGHHPAFLIYPCVYTITGAPLLLGSLIPVLERSPAFMGTAGGLLAATGLLDTILWSSIILFSGREDIVNTGLDQFTFMRTPEGRTLGNIVFVQGGGKTGRGAGGRDGNITSSNHNHNNNNNSISNNNNINNNNNNNNKRHLRHSWQSKKDAGWWRLRDRNGSQPDFSNERLADNDGGIQMEVVTSVVIEGHNSVEQHSREFSSDTTMTRSYSLASKN